MVPRSVRLSSPLILQILIVAAVLSGNRNFEGRVNPQTRFNYLASPPLVVAYALAGRMDIDLEREPLGVGPAGPVFLRDIWPSPTDVEDEVLRSVKREMFQTQYADVFKGDEQWRALPARKRTAGAFASAEVAGKAFARDLLFDIKMCRFRVDR